MHTYMYCVQSVTCILVTDKDSSPVHVFSYHEDEPSNMGNTLSSSTGEQVLILHDRVLYTAFSHT